MSEDTVHQKVPDTFPLNDIATNGPAGRGKSVWHFLRGPA